jgi:hypothetical protein
MKTDTRTDVLPTEHEDARFLVESDPKGRRVDRFHFVFPAQLHAINR